MEAVQKRPSPGLKQFLATRRGAWTAAALSAVLAGAVLLLFLDRYKTSVNEGVAPAPVLVADRVIPAGTNGGTVVTDKLFKAVAIPEQELKLGSVTDAQVLLGKVTTRAILPGQQITVADFAVNADPIRSRIAKTQRAVQIPVDATRTLAGTLRPGDRIDILSALGATEGAAPSLSPLIRDVRLLGVGSGSVILQLTDRQAAQVALASDNSQLWFLLRPPVGAEDSRPTSVTLDNLLVGGKPLDTKRSDGGETPTPPGASNVEAP
jgi:Flp pilus assembly protein CpaB